MSRPAHTSRCGVQFVAGWEGLSLVPYDDPAGNATVGYGHLLHEGPVTPRDRDIYRGFTRQGALELLAGDLRQAEAAVLGSVRPPLQWQHRFDAIVSFVFNVGAGAFERSRLLELLNTRTRRGAADELLKWEYAGGQPLPGLLNRRRAERRLFLYRRYG